MNTLFSYTLVGMLALANVNSANAFVSSQHPGFENTLTADPITVSGNWCDGTFALVATFGNTNGTWSWMKDGAVIAGANSDQLSMVHLETGIYTAIYQSTDGATTLTEAVNFTLPGPKSHFVFLNDAPIGVTRFADNSKFGDAPITSWHWDFGDGQTSTDQNPEHFYPGGGVRIYNVVLTTTDSNGCANSTTIVVAWN